MTLRWQILNVTKEAGAEFENELDQLEREVNALPAGQRTALAAKCRTLRRNLAKLSDADRDRLSERLAVRRQLQAERDSGESAELRLARHGARDVPHEGTSPLFELDGEEIRRHDDDGEDAKRPSFGNIFRQRAWTGTRYD